MNIHFVGIGGIGVSSLARHYFAEGHRVSGSDTGSIDELKEEGIDVYNKHSAKNIFPETDLLVYSNAVKKDNPEIKEAKRLKIRCQSYSEALGELTKKYFTIAISGTHGKSTTTAMTALLMIEGGLDPTVIIGTKLEEFGGKNYFKGSSKYLLIEADEYKAALLNYFPKIALISNIEEDHLDYYKDIDDILDTFEKYLTENLKMGKIILNKDDKNSEVLKKRLEKKGKKVTSYSLKDSYVKKINLSVFGKHNLYNAVSAYRIGKELGIREDRILSSLLKFKGTWRRFEEKRVMLESGKKIDIINDYAHHPTEIKATLSAAGEKYPERRIILVFQPHQYERTYRMFTDFTKALSCPNVDITIITDIYSVKGRESKEIIGKVSGRALANSVKNAIYGGKMEETRDILASVLQGDEILVIMGAGDIYKLEDKLKGQL